MLDVAQRFGLPAPEVNAWLLERYLVDFLWRDAAPRASRPTAMQVHGTASARRDDARRDHALRRAGFPCVRVGYDAVTRRPGAVAAQVAAASIAAEIVSDRSASAGRATIGAFRAGNRISD